MKNKKIFFSICLLFLLCIFGFWERKQNCIAGTEEIGDAASIGDYQDSTSGYSHVGVKINYNDVTQYFALDTWKKDTGGWEYIGSHINGNKESYDSYMYHSYPIWLFSPYNCEKRFMLQGNRVVTSSDCSVVLRRYRYGKLLSTSVEYSFQPTSIGLLEEFSLFQNTFYLSTYSANAVSYIYDIYPAMDLTNQTAVLVNLNGGRIESPGKMYRTATGYYLHTFPSVSNIKTGYQTTFLGWYSMKEGGTQYQEGDIVPKGTVLYAHWEEEALLYPVTCIDIAGIDSDGEVLGNSTWQEEYGTEVSGAMQGSDSTDGKYYTGYQYTGCTTAITGTTETIVYRYFEPTEYTVYFEGNGATGGNMAPLSHCKYAGTVTLTRNCFQKENKITLHLQEQEAEDSDTVEIYVPQSFSGWALEPDGGVRYSDGAVCEALTKEETSITLYAIWGEEKTEIDYTPKRLGYQFAGWTQTEGGSSGGLQFTVTSDMDLYAVWKPDVTKYQVETYKENLSGVYEIASSYTVEGYTGSIVEIDTQEDIYPGFTLDEKSSRMSGTVKADGSLVLSAFYRRNTYRFSYDCNGGSTVDGTSMEEDSVQKYGVSFLLTTQKLLRSGYTFVGWSQEADGSHTIYQPGETFTMQNHDVTLYAVWEPLSYQICLSANSEREDTEEEEILTGKYGQEFDLPECSFERVGYEFSHWNTQKDGNGISYQAGETIMLSEGEEGDRFSLYAQWTPLTFAITYDKNETEKIKDKIGGVVPDTKYCYTEDCYASALTFHAAGYTVTSWNTKADGTGISVQPGENIKGKLGSKEECCLYAIWEANTNTTFTVQLFLEGEESAEDAVFLETLILYGTTDETVEEAIKRLYQEELQGEDVKYFYEGYVVCNTEELDQTIQGDMSTEIVFYLRERIGTASFQIYQNQQLYELAVYTAEETPELTLPEEIESIPVSRYIDPNGNCYFPKETLSLKRDITLIIQHTVSFWEDSGKQMNCEEFVSHGKVYSLPEAEKTGYQFLGWYTDDGTFAGNAGEDTDGITQDMVYTAKWSEPLRYRISYDIDDLRIQILEQLVSEYQYMEEVVLPDANQIWVEESYSFVGWYDSEDTEKTILTKIAAGEFGDKTLKALLVKKETQEESSSSVQQENTQEGSVLSQDSASKLTVEENQEDAAGKTVDSAENSTGKTVFWYRNIRYRITLDISARKTVKVIGIRKKKGKVIIPKRAVFQGVSYQVTSIAKKAFYQKKQISTVVIADSVTTVGRAAFADMKKLKKVVLGKNVHTIGQKAFQKAKNLRKVMVRSRKIQKVGKNVFAQTHPKLCFQGKKKGIKILKKAAGKIS